jgi:hypothetical protein
MNLYATTDITLAAVLKEKGCSLDRIATQGTKGIFYFDNVDPQIVLDYDIGKITVEPIGFHSQIKNLTTAVKRLVRG